MQVTWNWQIMRVTAEQGGSLLCQNDLWGSVIPGGGDIMAGAGQRCVAHDARQPHITNLGGCEVPREKYIAAFHIPMYNLQTTLNASNVQFHINVVQVMLL